MPEIPYLSLVSLGFVRDDTTLFAGVNAELNRGDILQLEGPNGAGKTTLLRVLSGALAADQGEIVWRGAPLSRCRYAYQQDLLFIGHSIAVKASLTPLENLRWWRRMHPDRGLKDNRDLLAEIGLLGLEDTPCYSLSAGQLRRVALARMLTSPATLWILDEPFTAIDKQGVGLLEKLMEQHVQRGGIIVLSSHQPLALSHYQRLHLEDYRVSECDAG